jgi:WD40 repeat protein/actin-like ATPase involved in cell morphogenesis
VNDASEWSLAIDFGTSNTTAAMTADGGAPVVLEVENSRYLPSAVYAADGGELLTGRAAVRQGVVFPDRVERAPKRALAKQTHVLLGGEPREVVDLVAAVLRRMHTEAVRIHGDQPPGRVVLTHPARWGAAQLGQLREAAARAGIAQVDLLSEPVAAAWWYARPSAGQVVAVFDLGGGTLDTAVLRAGTTGYQLAGAPGGDADLGGEDFDELLLAQVGELARERDESAWDETFGGDSTRERRDRALLRADVTAVKEALSDHVTYDLAIMGYSEAFRLTRPEFESMIAPVIDSAVAEMRRTLTAAGAKPADLSGLYLTGGSSRIPAIASRLEADLGVQPQLRDDPKAAVARGALAADVPAIPVPVPPVPVPPKAASASATTGSKTTGGATPGAATPLGRAGALLAQARLREAATAYLAVLKQDRQSIPALVGLSTALARQGRTAEAETAARQAVALAPASAAAHAALSAALNLLKRYQEAESEAREAIRLYPGHGRAQVSLGRALNGLKRYAEGMATLQRVIDSDDPDAADYARLNLAAALAQQPKRDLPRIRELMQQVIGVANPDHVPRAHVVLAGAYMLEKDAVRARQFFRLAISSGHPDAAPRGAFLLGRMEFSLNNKAAGETALRAVSDSGHPDFAPRARAAIAKLHIPSRKVRELICVTHRLTVAQFSPDGRILATAGSAGVIWLWNPANGSIIRKSKVSGLRKTSLRDIAYRPDGRVFATAGGENTARLWDAATGQATGSLVGHADEVRTVAFSPDGRMLATGSRDKTACVWDATTARCVLRLTGHANLVHDVAYRPDGRMLATVGGKAVRLWDLPSGKCARVLTGQGGWLWYIAFSPDGKLIASCGQDGTIWLWETDSGAQRRTLTGHTAGVSGVAFSPDGQTLATSSYDKTVRLWDVTTGTQIDALTKNGGKAHWVSWHPDGSMLAVCGGDGDVYLWM